jgi:predicted DNA-binding transcriptional regulator YafY
VSKLRADERRIRLWLIVFRRKKVSVRELAEKLEVCPRTIRYDIAHMISSYPIDTVRGKYTGCVKLEDDEITLNGSLTEKQIDFLFHLWAGMNGQEAATMWSIIETVTSPKDKRFVL